MQNIKMEMRNPAELIPYVRNPRKNDAVVSRMIASITEFGFKTPVIARSDGSVIDGHLRLKAALKMGLTEVPVIIADDLTDAQIKAFRLLANQSANWADWDDDLLKLELSELHEMDFDIDMIGFADKLLASLELEPEALEPEALEPEALEPESYVSRIGDVWICGRHRVMCGDCTDASNVARLMAGEMANLMFTDPPYGMGKEYDGVANDNMHNNALLEFNRQWIPITWDVLVDNASIIIWGLDDGLMDIHVNIFKPYRLTHRFNLTNVITWEKQNPPGRNWDMLQKFVPAGERCLFYQRTVQQLGETVDMFFEPFAVILEHLQRCAEKAGLTPKKVKELCGVDMYSHWFTRGQWQLIPEKHYRKLQAAYPDAFDCTFDSQANDKKLCAKNYKELAQQYRNSRVYFNQSVVGMTSDVWRFNTPAGAEREECGGHATPKPVEMVEFAVKTTTKKDWLVLDVFGGSGSTLIACERTGRRCYMMELQPQYVDVIVKRWQKLTGQDAVLEGNGQIFEEVRQWREKEKLEDPQ